MHLRIICTGYLFSSSRVNHMWILKNSKELLETLSSRSQYVCNCIKNMISRPYIPPPHTPYKNLELKNWFSVVSQRRTENKCISNLLLVEISLTLLIAIQNMIINIPRTRSSSFEDECFNRQLIFQWVIILHLYLPICFYTLMTQTSFDKGVYRWCSVTEQFSIRWLSASHLFKWAWNK